MRMHRSILKAGGVAVATAMFGMAGSVQAASIADTKHNLSTSRPSTNEIYSDSPEICIFCHTPHAAIKNDVIPLWNHDLSTVATYGTYTSATFNGDTSIRDLGGATANTAVVSNLCLSCHDGTTAINSLNNPSNKNPNITMSGSGQSGGKIAPGRSTNLFSDGTLGNDHPVNFLYSEAANEDSTIVANPDTVRFYGGYVQCASCHDPHEANPANLPFLRVTIDGSQLCFKCHAK